MLLFGEYKDMYMKLVMEHTDYANDHELRKMILQSVNESNKESDINKFKILGGIEKRISGITSKWASKIDGTASNAQAEAERTYKMLARLMTTQSNIFVAMGNKENRAKLRECTDIIDTFIDSYKAVADQNGFANVLISYLFLIYTRLVTTLIAILLILTNDLNNVVGMVGGDLGLYVGLLKNLIRVIVKLIKKIMSIPKSVSNKKREVKAHSEAAAVLVGIPVAIVLMSQIVPFMREVIYAFYYSKLKLSDSLQAIGDSVEYNALNLELEKLGPNDVEKRNKIISRQKTIANKLKGFASKVDSFADSSMKRAKKEAQKAEKEDKVTLDMIKDAEKNTDIEDFSIMI